MSLSNLIDNQKIIIDDHKRGNREIKNWDSPDIDVHIDKKTDYPIDGKLQSVRIKVPINSNRPITIENAAGSKINIPSKLRKEIGKAFENKKTRESFINDLVDELKNFGSILSSEEKARQALKNISKHFDLEWTEIKISTYLNDTLQLYTELYTNRKGKEYYITVDREKIKIGQNTRFSRHQVATNKKKKR